MGETAIVNTPYDDVFRTLLNDCSSLIIPVINEIFGENYSGKEKIDFYPNEHFLNKQAGNESERITDTYFVVCGEENKKYHLECQSANDSSMIIRMFEYDTQIALDSGIIEGDTLKVKFPNSAILFLRSNNKTPNRMKIEIETFCGTISHFIPIMKSKDYTIEEIFDKDLLFLIPFYIFVYENKLKEYDEDESKLKELKKKYEYIKNELERLNLEEVISEYVKCTIIDMCNKVLGHIAEKCENVKEGVRSVMGGKILEYEAKAILNKGIEQGREQGIEQGIEQGREQGILQTYFGLIKDGIMSLKDVAQRLNVTEEELKAQMGM